jgi:carbon storage regulator
MLVLSRKLNEAIVIDGNSRIMVVDIRGGQVRLGIEAPAEVPILREELCASARPGENKSRPGARPERRGLADKATPTIPVSSACRP